MKITSIETTTVRLPIEAPIRHSYGAHSGFVRTLVEVHTDEGVVGLSETIPQPGDAFAPTQELLAGEDVFDLERIQMKIVNAGYISTQAWIAAAVEIACLDAQGKATGLPMHKLLGGALNATVPLSAYLFYRYESEDGAAAVGTPEAMAQHAADLRDRFGFGTFKLKGGVLPPEAEADTMRQMRDLLGPQARLRIDPNACWTPETAVRTGLSLEDVDLEYLEDPAWGISGMARVHERVRIPMATNMCVTWFDHLGPAIEQRAVDIILTDPWFWGGPRNCKALARMCQTMGLGVGMHSGLESGVGLAAMLHTAATMPNLKAAIDAHYHHLTDDVIVGGLLEYKDGEMAPPPGPGLGVELDRDKVARYAEAHQKSLRSTTRPAPDPTRPHWFPDYPRW
jgi:glucarate dehydratase